MFPSGLVVFALKQLTTSYSEKYLLSLYLS